MLDTSYDLILTGTLRPPADIRQWTKTVGMTQTSAAEIVGGLSSPGKMPCHSYGLPAAACHVGSKLRASHTVGRPTVCGSCYAFKGNYVWQNVQAAQYRRLASLADPRWIRAMVALIGWQSRTSHVFRWHDSGDLQSVAHLDQIAAVADRLPWVTFWIPTREAGILRDWIAANGPLPANLTVRQSCALVGHFPDPERAGNGRVFSAVARRGQEVPAGMHACPASKQDGHCGDCRACWSPDVPVVVYPLH
jgi:hypothetical protein